MSHTLYYLCIVIFRKEQEMERMKVIAVKAVNISSEAYNITRDAVNQQKNIRYNKFVLIRFLYASSLYFSHGWLLS